MSGWNFTPADLANMSAILFYQNKEFKILCALSQYRLRSEKGAGIPSTRLSGRQGLFQRHIPGTVGFGFHGTCRVEGELIIPCRKSPEVDLIPISVYRPRLVAGGVSTSRAV